MVPGISVDLSISSQIFQSCKCRVGCGYMGNFFVKSTVTHEQSILKMCDLLLKEIPDLYFAICLFILILLPELISYC